MTIYPFCILHKPSNIQDTFCLLNHDRSLEENLNNSNFFPYLQVFNEMVLPKLKEFMEGRNQLIFTYGATSSGKTFTIQGSSDRPGILPRALDSIL